MAHASSRRGSLAGDEAHDRLYELCFDVFRCFFLCRSSDFTDQDDSLCLFVFFKKLKKLDELEPDNWIAANSDRKSVV